MTTDINQVWRRCTYYGFNASDRITDSSVAHGYNKTVNAERLFLSCFMVQGFQMVLWFSISMGFDTGAWLRKGLFLKNEIFICFNKSKKRSRIC